ncbi:MAG: ThuA domain-containing protein, partial [Planctomyces sp.]
MIYFCVLKSGVSEAMVRAAGINLSSFSKLYAFGRALILLIVIMAGRVSVFSESISDSGQCEAAEPLRALIVDGQNNHGVWPQTTQMMKQFLEESGRFTVEVATAAPKGTDPNFHPEFSRFAVVISNFGHGAAPWPAETQKAFEDYVRGGGGFVVIHAANNSFPEWTAYNQMIGLGGWGGRTEKDGPYIYM